METVTHMGWSPLRDVLTVTLQTKLKKWSDGEVSDFIEEKITHIAECLRNEVASWREDGVPPTFEIDSEESPYIRGLGRDDSVLQKLRQIDPFVVEEVCAEILGKLGALSKATQRTNDGGVDFIGTDLEIMPNGYGTPAVCRATVIGQVKRYKASNIVTEKCLREFVGAGVLRRHKLRLDSGIRPLAPVILAFWTTSSFEPNAKIFAREVGLWYMEGHTLSSYVQALGLADFVFALPDAIQPDAPISDA